MVSVRRNFKVGAIAIMRELMIDCLFDSPLELVLFNTYCAVGDGGNHSEYGPLPLSFMQDERAAEEEVCVCVLGWGFVVCERSHVVW